MDSRSLYTLSLLAIGFFTVNAKDLDFQDLSGSGLPLGGSKSDDDLSFNDGVQGDSLSGDLALDDLSSSSPSSSSSLDGLSEVLGIGDDDNLFADATANTFGGGDLHSNDRILDPNLNFSDGKGDANLNYGDEYDDSLEPITSTIHTTTTICPVGKDNKPTGAVPVPDSDYQFPDGTKIGDTRQDSNLAFPDGTNTGNTLPDSDLSFPDGTDAQDTLSNSDLSFPDGTDTKNTFPDSDLSFPDGTDAKNTFPDSDLSFPDGTDTQNLQDHSLPIGDDQPYKDDTQQVTVTVTQAASGPTGGCGQPAPLSNDLGNVCKQMMAVCAPYIGQDVNSGFTF